MKAYCLIPNLLLYGIAAVLAASEHWWRRPVVHRIAIRAFRAGVVVHTAYLAALLWWVGYPFITSRGIVMGLMTWTAAVTYALLARASRWQSLAGWFLPLIFLLVVQSVVMGPEYPMIDAILPDTWLAALHLAMAASAVALCLVGALLSGIAVAADRRLKSRRPGGFWLTLPTRPAMESAVTRTLTMGLIALTGTMATGIVIAAAWTGARAPIPFRHQWAAFLAWTCYAVAVRSRWMHRFAGRRGLAVAGIGCLVVLLSFVEAHWR